MPAAVSVLGHRRAMNFSITIDGKNVDVQHGMSILDAARKAGIDIPSLCYLEKCGPINSCLVCLVKWNGRLVPACGIKVQPGMAIESETPEVHDARRTALELILSDHVGDCYGPCTRLCPLDLNVPVMLRQVCAGNYKDAILTVRNALPLARVVGRLCHHPCEQGCRRASWDRSIPIREIERIVADSAAGSAAQQCLPPNKSPTGKQVAVVGSGPTGLTAAWFLARDGHAVTVYERNTRAGGTLLEVDGALLPREILEDEISLCACVGIDFKLGVEVGRTIGLDELTTKFDAVLLANGQQPQSYPRTGETNTGPVPLQTDNDTFRTNFDRVFAAGSLVRPIQLLIRAMAEGRAAAHCISLALQGRRPVRPAKPFSCVMGRLERDELEIFVRASELAAARSNARNDTHAHPFDPVAEAARCLHCDCRAVENCDLQRYAELYGANASRFKTGRRRFQQESRPGGIVFEPGKCILCGICVKLTELGGEPLGLAFSGRGFGVRITVPFNRPIDEGVRKVMAECIEHCPTGALSFAEGSAVDPRHGEREAVS